MDGDNLSIDPFVVDIALEDSVVQSDGAHVVEIGDFILTRSEVVGLAVATHDVGIVPSVFLSGSADIINRCQLCVVVNKSDVVGDDAVAVV